MFKDNRGSGVSTFSVANFLSHSPENFRRGIPYFSSKVGYRKSLEKKGGEHQHFPSKNFCLGLPKNSVGESFTVALNSCSEKAYGQEEEGSIKIFLRKFLSHSAEIFRRAIFYCCANFGYRKSFDNKGGVSRLSVEIFLSHSAETLGRGNPYCYSNFGYRNCRDKKGGIKIFRRNLFVSQCRKFT